MDLKAYKKELEKVRKLIKRIEAAYQSCPSGTLWMEMNQNKYPQFYWGFSNEGTMMKKKYLSKKEGVLLQNLAQKEYYEKLLKKLKKQEKALRDFLNTYDEDYFRTVYESIAEPKRKFITPYRQDDDVFIRNWYKKHDGPKNPMPMEDGLKTNQGESVRSKTEMIFANELHHLEIPYLYEAPFKLKDGRIIYPDFTVLNVKRRKTYFIELMGMMDTPEYCNTALERLKTFSANEVYLGDSLLILMESNEVPLDSDQMVHLIHSFLV